jgi:hypothetical protein
MAFKSAFISASRGLGGRLDNVELKLIGVSENTKEGVNPPTSQHVPNHLPGLNPERTGAAQNRRPTNQQQGTTIEIDNDVSEELVRVETRVDNMEQKLTGLISKSDERAIRFAGLAFQSIAGSNAWLEANLPEHQAD